MPLNGNDLGDAIFAAVNAVPVKSDRTALFHAMGTAIVTYLVANTVVVVASVSAVTPGAGVSGSGAGTIT